MMKTPHSLVGHSPSPGCPISALLREARGGMARGDRGVARRAKPGLPRHSFATAGGFGVVPLGFATDGRGASLFVKFFDQLLVINLLFLQ
jgi:hypothetical protein